MTALQKIKSQAVGAYGEKIVEAELLRRLWVPANVNASIKNAADFDIFALKDGHTVHIRVKTCGPGAKIFQYGGFRRNQKIAFSGFQRSDFTVLVSMGISKNEDDFYILPTSVVRKALSEHREFYLSRPRRDGKPRADTGHWSLRLKGGKEHLDPGWGLEQKWIKYKNWDLLEKSFRS